MSSKFQIFVSSTYVDLKEPRDLVIKAVLEMGHIPVGMEMFSAADEEQWNIIQRQIDQSDYYILIMANRYGSVTDDNISYTEKEFDYARSKGVPCLGFILDSSTPWPSNLTDTEPNQVAALNLFRDKVKQRPVSFWKNNDDLYGKCSIALMKAFVAYPREGWIRASQYSDSKLTSELARLSAENAQLRSAAKAHNEKSEKAEEVRGILRTLQANSREIWVWKKKSDTWEEVKSTNLLELFRELGPGMLVENSVAAISRYAAQIICGLNSSEFRRDYPVPSNSVKEWMADFATLGLVKPSAKKKPVADKDEYWTLTEQGQAVLSFMRLMMLEQPRKLQGSEPMAEKASGGDASAEHQEK
ncbi:DUF4062 domain-containing protein [Pseudomonas sp. LPH60]|uniref:DUF4062 domain-containing protein n=1 Tax=Pseudomonas sp. LPH60 TaxID=3065906 RepID=UPI00273B6E99|nr:DUF4062 domain-containing protein [Pseudomonas sp. LPH60]MDP4572352.1 DUF4062 domain-containing protein [Pseudomonas sp. LPH60]